MWKMYTLICERFRQSLSPAHALVITTFSSPPTPHEYILTTAHNLFLIQSQSMSPTHPLLSHLHIHSSWLHTHALLSHLHIHSYVTYTSIPISPTHALLCHPHIHSSWLHLISADALLLSKFSSPSTAHKHILITADALLISTFSSPSTAHEYILMWGGYGQYDRLNYRSLL